mmetsp:Transcript_6874/g.12273  ORF Transcript_6874/g.12273 Transcript_6874/m.12273 type:complete len:218 (+) Transcript_6874:741-1394(+)
MVLVLPWLPPHRLLIVARSILPTATATPTPRIVTQKRKMNGKAMIPNNLLVVSIWASRTTTTVITQGGITNPLLKVLPCNPRCLLHSSMVPFREAWTIPRPCPKPMKTKTIKRMPTMTLTTTTTPPSPNSSISSARSTNLPLTWSKWKAMEIVSFAPSPFKYTAMPPCIWRSVVTVSTLWKGRPITFGTLSPTRSLENTLHERGWRACMEIIPRFKP